MKTFTSRSCVRMAYVIGSLLPGLASAQSDTLTISGTFQAAEVWGVPGPDLYGIYANGQAHTWTLTMQGVMYEEDYSIEDLGDGTYDEQYITRAQATLFTLEFFGPDGNTLNSIVSAPLTEATVQLVNGAFIDPTYFDPPSTSPYFSFYLDLLPADPFTGVNFSVSSNMATEWFNPGYPTFDPQVLPYSTESITDHRPQSYGALFSYSPAVYINSAVQPPPKPHVSIADGSKLEGHKGTTALALTLSLSSPLSEPVSVQYQTIDGTASSSGSRKSPADYSAATGTVTFQPGQTSRTISVLVNGDRTKESNETFTVQLSTSSSQVEFSDSTATATILNDD